jgi:hypothetical protein
MGGTQPANHLSSSRATTQSVGFEPRPAPWLEAFSTTAPHAHMYSYLFSFYSFYTTQSVNRFFKTINRFKLKTCQL